MEIGLLSNENENKKKMMVFEETELRLGLPGNNNNSSNKKKKNNGGSGGGEGEGVAMMMRKRGFCETEEESDESESTVDLMLNLSSSKKELIKNANNNGSDPLSHNNKIMNSPNNEKTPIIFSTSDPSKPPAAKAQVVGWPPVRSYRKNVFAVQKSGGHGGEESGKNGLSYVKVSMDGAPYLRKVDLKMYKNYTQLSDALGKMFSTIENCESQGMKDFMNERKKLMDVLNSSDYVPTYEDKDGDWMLVGDVPWEMFIESCKRLRIMRGKEAIGLAPKAMEKCKNRS